MMAGARAVLGPVMMFGERSGWSGLTLAAMVVAALLSDIFDGVLARKWKCDTPSVRLFDSMADIVFYIGCGAALFMRCPQLLRSFSIPIMAVIGLEALCIGFAIIKFGKPPSYHSYLAKSWGLALATTLVLSFAATNTRTVQIAWWASSGLGAFACLEGFAISLIMPEWRHDLKTLWRALAVRRYILLDRKRDSRRRSRLRLATIAAILIATVTASASASSIDGVTFSGGTAPGVTTGAEGELETGTDQLIFRWSGGSLVVPYAQIQNLSYRDKKALNLGALPLVAVLLIFPQIYHHIVTITYLDASGQKQVAIFQIPRRAIDTLPAVLQERTGLCVDQYQLPCRFAVGRNLLRPLASSEIVVTPRH
jgi:phosphatidylglycerophosphate synthase